MRSETVSTSTTLILVLGIFLLFAAISALVTGRVKLSGSSATSKEEKPGTFWAMVVALGVIGLIAFGYGAVHFGPGG